MAERHRPDSLRAISRRRFLKGAGGAAAGFLVAGCLPKQPVEAPGPEAFLAPTIPPTNPSTSSPSSKVAIAQAESYDRALVRQGVQSLLDGLGGLDDIVSPGDWVAIKVNLVGGSYFKPWPGVSAVESYITHPEVVRAMGELTRDAGARELFIIEAIYDRELYSRWGYEEVAEAVDGTLLDLNYPHPYDDFALTPAGKNWFI